MSVEVTLNTEEQACRKWRRRGTMLEEFLAESTVAETGATRVIHRPLLAHGRVIENA